MKVLLYVSQPMLERCFAPSDLQRLEGCVDLLATSGGDWHEQWTAHAGVFGQ